MADVAEEYRSSLSELNFNSKPHINMLTMLADENVNHAPLIVQTIIDHINVVPPEMKLPSLYLIDSIIKNVGRLYIPHFSKHLVSIFTSVFEKVDEKIRSLLYKLRATWTGIFPNQLLLQLDKSVVLLDPAWPILAQSTPTNIHVNPKFLDGSSSQLPVKNESAVSPQTALLQETDEIKKKQVEVLKVLEARKQQLMELKKAVTANASTKITNLKIQKVVDTRDPRLKRKLNSNAPESPSTLQSVVVLAKPAQEASPVVHRDSPHPENVSKRKSVSPDPKESKQDFSSSHNVPEKKANFSELCRHMKSNIRDKWHKNNSSHYDEENKSRSRKRHMSPAKSLSGSKLDKNSKSDSLHKKNSVISAPKVAKGNYSNEMLPPPNFKNEIDMNKRSHYDNKPRMEPTSPVLFGREDKDYRTILLNDVGQSKRMKQTQFIERVPPSIVKSFKLDNKDMKVYFVNDRAFAVMDDNIPRELTFEGPPRNVYIEGMSHPIFLGFGGQEIMFDIDGTRHVIRFGTPGREIYINNYPYEAQFGGPPFIALLDDGRMHKMQIDGPPPQVILSKNPAIDLYERFCESNKDFLSTYDNVPRVDTISSAMDVDMRVNTSEYPSPLFNFPVEKVNQVDWNRMDMPNLSPVTWNTPVNSFETYKGLDTDFITNRNYPERPVDCRPPPLLQTTDINHILSNFPNASRRPDMFNQVPSDQYNNNPMQFPVNDSPTVSRGNELDTHHSFENPPVSTFNHNVSAYSNNPLPPPPIPPFLNCVQGTSSMSSIISSTAITTPILSTNVTPTTSTSSSLPSVNVDQFLETLIAAGIIKKTSEQTAPAVTTSTTETIPPPPEKIEIPEEDLIEETVPEITFDPKCLKTLYTGVIRAFHTGLQCATCGMRFKEIHSEQYSRHLDWHFRMNRREKDGAKKPFSRRWYYEIEDWNQFKEFEDVDERAPSYFELQANDEQAEGESDEILCSVPSTECESEICAVCGEQFQLFWVEEEEEWHLRNAVKHNDQVYHPACYEDFKKASEAATADTSMEESADALKMEAEESADAVKSEMEESADAMKMETEGSADVVKIETGESADGVKMETGESADVVKVETGESVAVVKEDRESSENVKVEIKTETPTKSENSQESKENVVTDIVIKQEPMDVEGNVDTQSKENLNGELESTKSEQEVKLKENLSIKSENVDKNVDVSVKVPEKLEKEEEEIEFRPPTPDPRFEVLPPVTRGNELSALCIIM